jgi:ketosteroid isomerase-like protein
MPLSVQTVQALYADFAQGNLSKILAVIDEHTTIYTSGSLPYGGVYKGRDGFIALMTAANKTWASLRMIPGTALGSDEEMVMTGEFIGKVPAAAEPIRLPFIHLWKMPAGVVTEIWLYSWDTAALLTYLNGTTL